MQAESSGRVPYGSIVAGLVFLLSLVFVLRNHAGFPGESSASASSITPESGAGAPDQNRLDAGASDLQLAGQERAPVAALNSGVSVDPELAKRAMRSWTLRAQRSAGPPDSLTPVPTEILEMLAPEQSELLRDSYQSMQALVRDISSQVDVATSDHYHSQLSVDEGYWPASASPEADAIEEGYREQGLDYRRATYSSPHFEGHRAVFYVGGDSSEVDGLLHEAWLTYSTCMAQLQTQTAAALGISTW
jgi:hypothetical protein